MSIYLTNDSGDLQLNFENYRKLVNPCGMIVNFSGDNAPNGWLICDGREISKTTYSALFDVIGTKYGSASNINNFKLPDLQDRIPVGKTGSTSLGATGGNSDISLNIAQLPSHNHTGTSDSNGAHTHTGTTDSAGTHNHTATDSGHSHSYDDAYFAENLGGGANNVYGTGSSTDGDNSYRYRHTPTTSTGYANITVANNGDHTHGFTTASNGSHNHGITIGNSGGGESIDIRNKFIVLNYIIKY
jgi:microcystin-dependent protein